MVSVFSLIRMGWYRKISHSNETISICFSLNSHPNWEDAKNSHIISYRPIPRRNFHFIFISYHFSNQRCRVRCIIVISCRQRQYWKMKNNPKSFSILTIVDSSTWNIDDAVTHFQFDFGNGPGMKWEWGLKWEVDHVILMIDNYDDKCSKIQLCNENMKN